MIFWIQNIVSFSAKEEDLAALEDTLLGKGGNSFDGSKLVPIFWADESTLGLPHPF